MFDALLKVVPVAMLPVDVQLEIGITVAVYPRSLFDSPAAQVM
jgi:hypothetical protein